MLISTDSPLSTKFPHQKIGGTTVFYAVVVFLKIYFLYHWDVFTILLNIHEGCFFKNCQRLLVVHFLAFFYWSFYVEIVNDYQPVTGFTYIYILDVWQGLKYTFVAYQFHAGFTVLAITASKLSVFDVFLVRLFLHKGWILRLTL